MTLPAPAPIEPRLIAAAGAAIVAGLLFLLYLNRRRAYVLIWIVGWLLVAGSVFAAVGDGMRFAGLHQAAAALSAAAFAVSASAVEGPLAWTTRHWISAALLGGWLALATPACRAIWPRRPRSAPPRSATRSSRAANDSPEPA